LAGSITTAACAAVPSAACNFVETAADASTFFEPAARERLRDVKRRYDPADLFVGNHHIPPAADAAP
jgi:hypothetical protein